MLNRIRLVSLRTSSTSTAQLALSRSTGIPDLSISIHAEVHPNLWRIYTWTRKSHETFTIYYEHLRRSCNAKAIYWTPPAHPCHLEMTYHQLPTIHSLQLRLQCPSYSNTTLPKPAPQPYKTAQAHSAPSPNWPTWQLLKKVARRCKRTL